MYRPSSNGVQPTLAHIHRTFVGQDVESQVQKRDPSNLFLSSILTVNAYDIVMPASSSEGSLGRARFATRTHAVHMLTSSVSYSISFRKLT